MEIANFFWEGELTKLEIASMLSFKKHGFYVKLWTFNNLDFYIDGIEVCDAKKVYPKEVFEKIFQEYFDKTNMNEQKQKTANYTSASDMFRTFVIKKFGGWYFDLDCICLVDVEKFIKLKESKEIIFGLHRVGSDNCYQYEANTHTIYLGDKYKEIFYDRLVKYLDNKDYKFTIWAETSNYFLNLMIKEYGLYEQVLNENYFNPLAYYSNDMDFLLDETKKELVQDKFKDSYILHFYHSQVILRCDKNNPPKNSILWDFYKQYNLIENEN